jgi:type 1 fimbriae regulatory protein FimE
MSHRKSDLGIPCPRKICQSSARAWFLKMVRRTGELAKLPFPVHPHMLRHACGFKLANDGVDTRALQHFLGHRNIMHTVRYTELRSDRFDGFWKD